MSDLVTLELVCGRCGHWWIRYPADLSIPFDEQPRKLRNGEMASLDLIRTQSPGSFRPATDGEWYRWAPGPAADLPDEKSWSRMRFTCPGKCGTAPQVRVAKFNDAVDKALRFLHATRTPLLTVTVDSLLRFAA